jgi:hypothetical protein
MSKYFFILFFIFIYCIECSFVYYNECKKLISYITKEKTMNKQWKDIPVKDNPIFIKMLEDKNKQARKAKPKETNENK